MSEVKINIGAGLTYISGFTNIDITPHADITLDLNKDQLPFEDNSVDLVFSYHCIEHIENYIFVLGEIHRVLKHGGRFLLGVPYVTLTEYHLVNPYHLHSFSELSFDFFDPRKLKNSAAEPNRIFFEKVWHRCHYMGIFRLAPPPLRGWFRRHLFNVVRKIDFGLVAVKDLDSPLPNHGKLTRGAMRNEFSLCMQSKTSYDQKEPDQNPGLVEFLNRQS